jgi:hypothetical protein
MVPTVCKSLPLRVTSFQGRGGEKHNITTIKKYAESLIEASTETDLEVNMEKTQYLLKCLLHNPGQNHNINRANSSNIWE